MNILVHIVFYYTFALLFVKRENYSRCFVMLLDVSAIIRCLCDIHVVLAAA